MYDANKIDGRLVFTFDFFEQTDILVVWEKPSSLLSNWRCIAPEESNSTTSITNAKTVFGRLTLALLIASNGFFIPIALLFGFYINVFKLGQKTMTVKRMAIHHRLEQSRSDVHQNEGNENLFSKGFNDHSDALTAPDASGRDAVSPTTALQFMSEGEHEASTCGCQWVTDSNGTAVDVDLFNINS